MRIVNIARLAVNGLGTLAWFAFLVQVIMSGHFSIDPEAEWMGVLMMLIAFLVPPALLYADFIRLSVRAFYHYLSSLLWPVLWVATGVVNGILTMSIGGWVGGWSDGHWYGHVATMLCTFSILALLAVAFTWILGRPRHEQ